MNFRSSASLLRGDVLLSQELAPRNRASEAALCSAWLQVYPSRYRHAVVLSFEVLHFA